jgi:apolipoprotein N-acyltransferase
VVRATNTGATAIIDHLGRVTARLPAHQRGVLYGQVWGREELTFFARWSAWGALLPLWLLGAGTVLLIAGRALRPARTPPV